MQSKLTIINCIKLLFLILIGITAIQCTKKEDETIVNDFDSTLYKQKICDLRSNLGEIYLDPNSKEFIPYPDSMIKIIFKDTSGQEFIGRITDFYEEQSTTIGTDDLHPCPIDSSYLISYHWKPEFRRINIEFEEVDIKFFLTLNSSISHENYELKLIADFCKITLSTPIHQSQSQSRMSIVVDPRTFPNPWESYSDFQEEYIIHDQLFYNVYINSIDVIDDFEIFYNSEFGILGFRNNVAPIIDLVYDRIEFE